MFSQQQLKRAAARRLKQKHKKPSDKLEFVARSVNRTEQGAPGWQRRGQALRVMFNPRTGHFEHVYGHGKKAKRVTIRNSNPLAAAYRAARNRQQQGPARGPGPNGGPGPPVPAGTPVPTSPTPSRPYGRPDRPAERPKTRRPTR